MPDPIRNSRIKLPQGQLFWREVGRGTTVVFLHGSWDDGEQWVPVVEQLSTKVHCLVPDLLGFGESERPKTHYSIALEVECLADYLDVLKQKQIYLVGHSLGAWIAASYALRYPDQVKGLVLLSPEGIQTRSLQHRWLRAQWLTSRPPLLYWLLRSLLPLARCLRRHQGIEQGLQQRRTLMRSPVACQLLFKRRKAELHAELMQGHVEWLKAPMLLLQGEADTSAGAVLSRVYAQAPDANLHQIPQAGADLLQTHPTGVATMIHYFIQSHL